jgi:glycosyltransferase involved in cell wall biosynthesis
MKVVFINNYPMDHAWELWKKREYPGHHLWGATHFNKYEIDVDIIPHKKYVILKKISSKIKILGDLDQQLRIFFSSSKYDLVYSGHYFNTLLLAFMRSMGIFKKPVVAIAFQAFDKNIGTTIFVNLLVKGHDKLICSSSGIRSQFKDKFNIPDEKLELLEWGVDLSLYKRKDCDNPYGARGSQTSFVLSAGKSYRDYNTLVEAFRKINCNLKIFCPESSAPSYFEQPSNIELQYGSNKTHDISFFHDISFLELLPEYEKAYAVAIPLDINPKTSYNMIGQTSLLDAMAMAKAIVMTRNRQIDIDIEKEGIGIWVEPGDVKGWQQAISYLLAHPQETEEMGKRAYYLCESQYNIELFSSGLTKILKTVLR